MSSGPKFNERLVELIQEHRTTLIFVNTRRLAERLTHQLAEKLGEGQIETHHGSVAADKRLQTERKLKSGELKAVVATASLELGIDIGYIDLVVQIGSPRSIATFLQRIGRSGHSLGLTPKGRLFALTRDELGESLGLLRAVRSGMLDSIAIPQAPLDVLAQQIVAEAAAQDWNVDDLFALVRRADPYRNLARNDFDRTIEYLSEGIARETGRGRVYLHHDHVGKRIKARKGARLAAIANAGAIPDIGSYRVIAEPDETVVGTLDEDFAVESMRGDVFLLGNTSWQILACPRRRGARGRRARCPAHDSVLAWRGARPHAGTFLGGLAVSRGSRAAAERSGRGRTLGDRRNRLLGRGSPSDRRLRGRRRRRHSDCCRPVVASSSSGFSTRRVACSSSCTPLSAER